MFRISITTLLLICSSQAQAVSELPEPNKDNMTKDQPQVEVSIEMPSYLLSTSKLSKETEALFKRHNKLIDDLQKADALMHQLIKKSETWSSENNKIKKGHIDAMIDKAERFAISNELRMKLRAQYSTISTLIIDIDKNRKALQKQRKSDEQRWAMEAFQAQIKKLELEKEVLKAQLKVSASTEKRATPGQTLSEESVQYFTVDTPMNLQSIAWRFYNDNEKWIILYDYPSNRKLIKEKSPSVIIPAGTVLTIPNLEEE